MGGTPKILAFSGSVRNESLNKKLAAIAARSAEVAGGAVTLIDLRDFPMPIYDGDLEAAQGLPDYARQLKALFKAHQGLSIATPENNGSLPSLLKNTVDWLFRPDASESGLVPYRGKVAGLLAASPGLFGGVRGLFHLREILQKLEVVVLPEMVTISRTDTAFAADGHLLEAKLQKSIDHIGQRLVTVSSAYRSEWRRPPGRALRDRCKCNSASFFPVHRVTRPRPACRETPRQNAPDCHTPARVRCRCSLRRA
jgi:chromate reductase, NAD(P)H dehydrogenase (quinone)